MLPGLVFNVCTCHRSHWSRPPYLLLSSSLPYCSLSLSISFSPSSSPHLFYFVVSICCRKPRWWLSQLRLMCLWPSHPQRALGTHMAVSGPVTVLATDLAFAPNSLTWLSHIFLSLSVLAHWPCPRLTMWASSPQLHPRVLSLAFVPATSISCCPSGPRPLLVSCLASGLLQSRVLALHTPRFSLFTGPGQRCSNSWLLSHGTHSRWVAGLAFPVR